jgi:ribonuclease Z
MAFELTILGSSSATPTSERYPTAQVLNMLGRFFLIDCGEGTQIQIRRQKIGFGKIKHIFISHLHGDHYYGLIGLISTFNLLGLKNDLHIYSPSQLKEIIQPQLDFLKGDLQFEVIFHPLNFKKPQLIFEDKKVEVVSFPLKHSINCCGFLFREKEKEANIKKECIQQYNIPIAQIVKIKQGAGFITEEGETIPHEVLTTPPPAAAFVCFLFRYCIFSTNC